MGNTQRRVLIVDDEEMIRVNLADYLEDDGFVVYKAASGEDAILLLKNNQIDVGIIDMRLSGMDGNAFIQQAHQINKTMKFIVYTGNTNYSLPQELLKIGLTEKEVYIKPLLDMEVFSNKIKDLCQ